MRMSEAANEYDFLLLLTRRRPDLTDILLKALTTKRGEDTCQVCLVRQAPSFNGQLTGPSKGAQPASTSPKRTSGLLSIKAHIEGAPWVRPDSCLPSAMVPRKSPSDSASAAHCSDSELLSRSQRPTGSSQTGDNFKTDGSSDGAPRAARVTRARSDTACDANSSEDVLLCSCCAHNASSDCCRGCLCGCGGGAYGNGNGCAACGACGCAHGPDTLAGLAAARAAAAHPGCSPLDFYPMLHGSVGAATSLPCADCPGPGSGPGLANEEDVVGSSSSHAQRLRAGSPSMRDLVSRLHPGSALHDRLINARGTPAPAAPLDGEGDCAGYDDDGAPPPATAARAAAGQPSPPGAPLSAVGGPPAPHAAAHVGDQQAPRRAHTGPLSSFLPLLPAGSRARQFTASGGDCVQELLMQQQLLPLCTDPSVAGPGGGSGCTGELGSSSGGLSPRLSSREAAQATANQQRRNVRTVRTHAFLPTCHAAHISSRLRRLRAQLQRFTLTPEPSQPLLHSSGEVVVSDGYEDAEVEPSVLRSSSSPARFMSRSTGDLPAINDDGGDAESNNSCRDLAASDYDRALSIGMDGACDGEPTDPRVALLLQRRSSRVPDPTELPSFQLAARYYDQNSDFDLAAATAAAAAAAQQFQLLQSSCTTALRTEPGGFGIPGERSQSGAAAPGVDDKTPRSSRVRRSSVCSHPSDDSSPPGAGNGGGSSAAAAGRQTMQLPVRQPQPPVLPYGGILRLAVARGSGLPLLGAGSGTNGINGNSNNNRFGSQTGRQGGKSTAVPTGRVAATMASAAAAASAASAAAGIAVTGPGSGNCGPADGGRGRSTHHHHHHLNHHHHHYQSGDGGGPEARWQQGCALQPQPPPQQQQPQPQPACANAGGGVLSSLQGVLRTHVSRARRSTQASEGDSASISSTAISHSHPPNVSCPGVAITDGTSGGAAAAGGECASSRPYRTLSDLSAPPTCGDDGNGDNDNDANRNQQAGRLSVMGNCRTTIVTPPPLLPSLKHQNGLRGSHHPPPPSRASQHRHSTANAPLSQQQQQQQQQQLGLVIRQEHPLKATAGGAAAGAVGAGSGGGGSGGGGGAVQQMVQVMAPGPMLSTGPGPSPQETAVAVVLAVTDGSGGSQDVRQQRQYKLGFTAALSTQAAASSAVRRSGDGAPGGRGGGLLPVIGNSSNNQSNSGNGSGSGASSGAQGMVQRAGGKAGSSGAVGSFPVV